MRIQDTAPHASLAQRPATLLSDLLVEELADLGYSCAFGIPGGPIASFFNSLSRSKRIRTVLAQHEAGGAYMAMGRALASAGREVGLCFATSGPGITNLITGVAAAYEERVPLMVITGNVSTALIGKGAVHDVFSSGMDVSAMLAPVTARSVTVMDPVTLLDTLNELHALALRTRRPVHLNIPLNIASSVATATSRRVRPQGRLSPAPAPDWKAMDGAIDVLLSAKRPLVLAGHGIKASGLRPVLKELLETVGLPALVTSHAKGILSDDHPAFMGLFGLAAPQISTDFLESYDPDAILFLGTGLGELSSGGWSKLLSKPACRVHIDWDPSRLNRVYEVTHPVNADIGDFSARMIESWKNAPDAQARSARIAAAALARPGRKDQDEVLKPNGPVHPVDFMQSLEMFLPENTAVFSDIGNTMAWAIQHLPMAEKQDFYLPLGFASMGSSVCAALGAKSASPDRPVVALIGDCAMLMQGSEMFSAQLSGLGVKVFVLNDAGHGMVHHGHQLIGLTDVDVRFPKAVDFKTWGESLGVKSLRIDNLGDFFKVNWDELLRSPEPMIIDVRIDAAAVPPIQGRTRVLGIADKTA